MAWTEEMIDGLKQMWKEGLTTNEIAKRLGVSKNSIVGKVHRLNLKARPSPIKKKEEITATEVTETKEEVVKQSNTPIKKITVASVNILTTKKTKKDSCLKLTDLDNHTCRWPIGDPKDDNFCFCGKTIRSGQTYCEEHAAIAYVKPIKKDK
ncbi:MAG: global cell cycle regulator GcrA-like protein [Alphaproteobacteria bacterium]|nr:global cell cycle regulator GcrA-like protein [Alphaproteobacteria bacterium]